ncbi:ribonuclease P protein component [Bartonella bacilliformis str. Heidi Mejia]|uniref:ribonuclease P protein component n=1 Tax=Bartonella bacilliformis TaxID=774 RepID=UPI0004505408|nr:ribonuclease P protein component [Bartonella bacilliformis]EYS92536.1 ribonuclease P protein component [Bartonella bacilliformis str. Heidi Mejia]KEG17094.1 ribonuclease P protein component [Bartonella bacilliformis Cond044]KEG19174.1 ribonuclease P protein component [Bartonella bacilliformis Hosp800-02]KEG22375.1 ribonuclease P protein component [Bartonella bacilliformis VAB9028]KEG24631.1 ribonuclease P protein component [Bartonella bacilliformis CAR600-02]
MKQKPPCRIRKRADFLAVRKGEKRRGPLFLLEMRSRQKTAETSSPLAARIGFTVTRKNGNAVKRNRIKRRLREAVRVGLTNDTKAGVDYVIVAYPDVLYAPFTSLISELSRRMKSKEKNQK